MARWYEGAEESAFKPTTGGYVFQPKPWVARRSRNYIVNESQKAEIAACLRRRQRLLLLMSAIYLLLTVALILSIRFAIHVRPGFLVIFLGVVILSPLLAVPQLYLNRALRPLLADLPRTDEQIAVGERLERTATAVSGKLLLLGALGGALCITGGLMVLSDAIAEGEVSRGVYRAAFLVVFGGVLTSYFAYLTILKNRPKRNP
jgi:hypothetical protein